MLRAYSIGAPIGDGRRSRQIHYHSFLPLFYVQNIKISSYVDNLNNFNFSFWECSIILSFTDAGSNYEHTYSVVFLGAVSFTMGILAYLFSFQPIRIQTCKHIVNIVYRKAYAGVPCPPLEEASAHSNNPSFSLCEVGDIWGGQTDRQTDNGKFNSTPSSLWEGGGKNRSDFLQAHVQTIETNSKTYHTVVNCSSRCHSVYIEVQRHVNVTVLYPWKALLIHREKQVF